MAAATSRIPTAEIVAPTTVMTGCGVVGLCFEVFARVEVEECDVRVVGRWDDAQVDGVEEDSTGLVRAVEGDGLAGGLVSAELTVGDPEFVDDDWAAGW
jgi:hypothetical protein